MTENKFILKEKSFRFAVQIIKLVQYLQIKEKEHLLSKQVFASGTAIGNYLSELEIAQSSMEIQNKLSKALEAANSTYYWVSLLKEGGYLSDDIFQNLSQDCKELIALLSVAVNALRS